MDTKKSMEGINITSIVISNEIMNPTFWPVSSFSV